MDCRRGVTDPTRLVGDYILGPKIGSGSFAVVWRSRHRNLGTEFAVKEIDKSPLKEKVRESLMKEISILRRISHPNIIHLHEAIETEERIFLVLEYCNGGDLADYLSTRGSVSESVARRFMSHLAAGLQELQKNHLVHRDLKPQNLLLSHTEDLPVLKIGDFGFARSVSPHCLANTMCGSPLYMAPEIFQNQEYDAKADLWSVGAILYQLVTGRPPYGGENQYELFQNILKSTDLQFPKSALAELHPDCVDLCRRLLRQKPVERLSFSEFFDHKFLKEPRLVVKPEQSSVVPEAKLMSEQSYFTTPAPRRHSHSSHSTSSSPLYTYGRNPKSGTVGQGILTFIGSTSSTKVDSLRNSVDADLCSSGHLKGADSVESIEKEYVLVNAHFASGEAFSYCLASSLQDSSASHASICPLKKNEQDAVVAVQAKEPPPSSLDSAIKQQSLELDLLATCPSAKLTEMQGLNVQHPSIRLQFLNLYLQVLEELVQEKHDAGLFLESVSVELVILPIWKKVLEICSSWLAPAESGSPESHSAGEPPLIQRLAGLSLCTRGSVDFQNPSSVNTWAEEGFIAAVDCAVKLSCHLEAVDGSHEMPDAIEIIYRKALEVGKSGAVHEYMGNMGGAATLYLKALTLFSFIVKEATLLQLKPPFVLARENKRTIENYITTLKSRQRECLKRQSQKSHTN